MSAYLWVSCKNLFPPARSALPLSFIHFLLFRVRERNYKHPTDLHQSDEDIDSPKIGLFPSLTAKYGCINLDISSKKRRDILILSLILVTLIVVVVVFAYYLIYYPEINTTDSLNDSNPQSSVIANIVIQPGSHWFYHINYSSINVVITLISGNFSALQPSIIDDTNFSLFQQGKPYQNAPETSNITFYKGYNYSGNIHAYDSNLVIMNYDTNNTSIVTIAIMYMPDRPVP